MGCIGCLGGPVCTGIMLLVSIWGIFFLAGMGGLFYNQSVGLLADIPTENKNQTWEDRKKDIVELYHDNARNCWIACGAYVLVFAYSAIRMYMIVR